ncbi:MAG: tail protein X [Alphaproteobacteria bacterium]
MKYKTRDKDMLDKICHDYYGTCNQGIMEKVLETNPNLADHGPVFKAGILIELPALARVTSQAQTISLWD